MRLSSMRDEKESEVSNLKADLLTAKRMIATSAGVVPRDVSQYLNTYSSPAPYVRPSLDVEYLNHEMMKISCISRLRFCAVDEATV
eukprot:scaffold24032_cov49-Attheya_sp.AAC.4